MSGANWASRSFETFFFLFSFHPQIAHLLSWILRLLELLVLEDVAGAHHE